MHVQSANPPISSAPRNTEALPEEKSEPAQAAQFEKPSFAIQQQSDTVHNIDTANTEITPAKKNEEAPSHTAQTSQDISSIWSGILQNITSIPSRMFFYNLSRPLELTAEGITIGFAKEIFVKQAQDNSKNAPLKKAAMDYFGVNDINIHIKLVDENEIQSAAPKPSLDKLEKKAPQPVNTASYSQEEEESIALIMNEQPHSNEVSDVIENKSQQPVSSESSSVKKDDTPLNISDRSRMVMELFNGKFID